MVVEEVVGALVADVFVGDDDVSGPPPSLDADLRGTYASRSALHHLCACICCGVWVIYTRSVLPARTPS